MKNKYLSFVKNAAIATATAVGVGMIASKLAGDFIDSSEVMGIDRGKIIGGISTISGYLSWWASFLSFQARDNRDVYCKNGKFDVKGFAYDNAKFAVSSSLFDIGFIFTRPFVQDYFIDGGMSDPRSSLAADSILIPLRALVGFGLAKFTGVIKPNGSKNTKNKTLEQGLERDAEAVLGQGEN